MLCICAHHRLPPGADLSPDRAGIKPVDHHRHNRSALRQQSEANRERKQADAEAAAQAEALAQQRKVRLPVAPSSRCVLRLSPEQQASLQAIV